MAISPSASPRIGRLAAWPVGVKLAVAGTLVAALLGVGMLTLQYRESRRPVTQLPGLPALGAAVAGQRPAYLGAFYGADGAPLSSPLGVAVSPDGARVYATESAGERAVLVFDRSGNVVGKLVPPNTQAGGRYPLYVAVDSQGTVYVSDRLRSVIDCYTPNAEYMGHWQPADATEAPRMPMALAFDAAGNFYVTDIPSGAHRLLVFDTSGRRRLAIGREGAGETEFAFPNSVVVDRRGRIYVSDSNNGRVQIFDSSGQLLDSIGHGGHGALGIPRGLAIDALDRLFIVDTVGQVVEVWDVAEEPHQIYTIGAEGVGAGQFDHPNGVALDSSGRLYVTDRLNNRLQLWSFAL